MGPSQHWGAGGAVWTGKGAVAPPSPPPHPFRRPPAPREGCGDCFGRCLSRWRGLAALSILGPQDKAWQSRQPSAPRVRASSMHTCAPQAADPSGGAGGGRWRRVKLLLFSFRKKNFQENNTASPPYGLCFPGPQWPWMVNSDSLGRLAGHLHRTSRGVKRKGRRAPSSAA